MIKHSFHLSYRFTQNLSVFRRDINDSLKDAVASLNSSEMMTTWRPRVPQRPLIVAVAVRPLVNLRQLVKVVQSRMLLKRSRGLLVLPSLLLVCLLVTTVLNIVRVPQWLCHSWTYIKTSQQQQKHRERLRLIVERRVGVGDRVQFIARLHLNTTARWLQLQQQCHHTCALRQDLQQQQQYWRCSNSSANRNKFSTQSLVQLYSYCCISLPWDKSIVMKHRVQQMWSGMQQVEKDEKSRWMRNPTPIICGIIIQRAVHGDHSSHSSHCHLCVIVPLRVAAIVAIVKKITHMQLIVFR